MTFAGVAEVAVVAAPDARMGEHAAAFVRMVGGTSGARSVRSSGTISERPVSPARNGRRSCISVEDFPRTSSGKVQKYVLRDRLRWTKQLMGRDHP